MNDGVILEIIEYVICRKIMNNFGKSIFVLIKIIVEWLSFRIGLILVIVIRVVCGVCGFVNCIVCVDVMICIV